MFHDIPDSITTVMADLEGRDARDRADGTPRLERLRQVPRDTGRFLALTIASAPPGPAVEVGTSAGYSALWLALGCRASRRRLTTYEILPAKAALARATFAAAGVEDVVDLVEGEFVLLDEPGAVAFAFVDAEKDVYLAAYERLIGRLQPGALLLADNVLSHAEELADFVARVDGDPRVDAVTVPIGKGVLLARRLP